MAGGIATAADTITNGLQRLSTDSVTDANHKVASTHPCGVNTSHDRHSHVHQEDIKGTALIPCHGFNVATDSLHSFLAVGSHLHIHAQATQHHFGHPLVDQIVLCQQH